MDTAGEEARKRFEEKHQVNSNLQSVEEFNRMRAELQKKREEENAPDEDADIFDKAFADKTRNIKSQISTLSKEDTIEKYDQLKHEVSEVSDFLNKSVHFLNPYTILQSQTKLNQLNEEINAAQATLAPRKKFAFSKRTAKKEVISEPIVPLKEISMTLEGIENQSGISITKQDSELSGFNCYQLKNLSNCQVYLLGRLKAVHIFNLSNCEVYIGPVGGAAHITECTNCIIHVMAHQIRIHQSQNTDFYIYVASNPIVENVSNVRFAPYMLTYKNIQQHVQSVGLGDCNLWDQVQDFKWLKQIKSPNWSILEESLRVPKNLDI
jgi:tubulin-specific chaperone C